VTGRHQHVFILFDLKYELFLHVVTLPQKTASGKPLPKSSPKRIETRKQAGSFGRDTVFSGATVKILALTAQIRRKRLSNRHFLRSAFYRAGFR
jgi:hypothetical protein